MNERQRLDFQIRVLGEAEDGSLKIELLPHPDRYEQIVVDGEPCLFDRLERAVIPLRVIVDGFNRSGPLPMFAQRQTISDSAAYAEARREVVRKSLNALALDDEPASDRSAENLDELVGKELGFVVLSIDIVGSTRIAATLPIRRFERMMRIILDEMSEVIPHFLGHVLKYTGDGLIAYFNEPSYITKNDLAADCALTLRRVIEVVNLELVEAGFPFVQVRIGIDSGEAAVTMIGSARTKRQSDLVGAVAHLATKIQEVAPPGAILLGDATVRSLHTSWRARTRPYSAADASVLLTLDGSVYPLHELD